MKKKSSVILRSAAFIITLCSGLCYAGDFSVHEEDARIFSKLISRCLKEGDAECLVARVRNPVILDAPKKFGCVTANPEKPTATPQEFVKCLLVPGLATKTKPKKTTLREIVQGCLSPKAKYDDQYKALRGSTGYWCFLGDGEVIGDDPQFAQISATLAWK